MCAHMRVLGGKLCIRATCLSELHQPLVTNETASPCSGRELVSPGYAAVQGARDYQDGMVGQRQPCAQSPQEQETNADPNAQHMHA